MNCPGCGRDHSQDPPRLNVLAGCKNCGQSVWVCGYLEPDGMFTAGTAEAVLHGQWAKFHQGPFYPVAYRPGAEIVYVYPTSPN